MHLFRCIFLFFSKDLDFVQLTRFEYRVLYEFWEFSQLMRFEPIRENGGNINEIIV